VRTFADSTAAPMAQDTSQSTSTNTLSWQSAFLGGLVPLALVAMSQPSILDNEFPQSNLLFPLRSSPFICFADTFDVIYELGYHLSQGVKLRDAARKVKLRRARFRLKDDQATIEEVGADIHPKTFATLFIWTLLQFIKLWSVQGLAWTKVWATIYFSSYFVLAAVGILGRLEEYSPVEDSSNRAPRSMSSYFPGIEVTPSLIFSISIFAHITLCGWVLYDLFRLDIPVEGADIESIGGKFAAQLYLISKFALFCSIFLPIIRYSLVLIFLTFLLWLPSHSYQRILGALTRGWAPWVISFVVLLATPPLGVSRYPALKRVFIVLWHIDGRIVEGTFLILVSVVAIATGYWLFSQLCNMVPLLNDFDSELEARHRLVIIAFFNFGLAFFYYRFRYDPEGTVKPGWAENLG
jgi:hypothetical protein